MAQLVRKAVIAAAGQGTRSLPATKALPKGLLPVVDKPVIQYVVEDTVSAGVDDIIMVTGWHKRTLEDHFDEPFELLARLEAAGKVAQAAELRRSRDWRTSPISARRAIRGTRRRSSTRSISCTMNRSFIPSGMSSSSGPTRAQQLVAAFAEFDAPILAAIRTTDPEDARKYSFVGGEEVRPGIVRVREIVEKPGPGKAPSDLAIVSGYVLTRTFSRFMAAVTPESDRELVYVEGLARMIAAGFPVYAMEVCENRYCDCGDKLAYLKANLEIARTRPEYAEDLRCYIRGLACGGGLGDALVAVPSGTGSGHNGIRAR